MIALVVLLAWPFSAPLPDDAVVARADGPNGAVTITARRLRAYAEAHPDRSPRALAEELIAFELLAAQARARGLAASPEVAEETREAMVVAYLAKGFGETWSAAGLPEALVRESYERNKQLFVRPDLVSAHHFIVTLAGKRPEDPALDQAARALAEEVRAAVVAAPAADGAAFLAQATEFRAKVEAAGLELRAESLGRFALEGRYDPVFSRAVFALTTPGEISPAFATGFGWHVARLEERLPAKDVSFAEAEAEIRPRIVPEVRELKLRELTERLGREHGAVVTPGPLEELARRQGLEGGAP